MQLFCASGFRVFHYENGIALIEVGDRRYLILPENANEDDAAFSGLLSGSRTAEDMIVLKRPVSEAYLAATAVMSLFSSLNALDSVAFSSIREKDWYIEEAKTAMDQGRITYAGKYNAPDYEMLMSEACPLAIESTMILRTPEVQEKLESLGIPVFIDYSSYEEDPLGRTEWIRCYGTLLGKEAEAEAFFKEQREKVRQVEKMVEKVDETERPRVAFFFINSTGKAVVRKTGDYIPKMISSAGGSYIFTELTNPGSNSGSVTISMEEFYETAKDADYLVYNAVIESPPASIADLVSQNGLFADFSAVKSAKVYIADNNMYQATDRTADIIMDLYLMMNGKEQDALYIRKLPEE